MKVEICGIPLSSYPIPLKRYECGYSTCDSLRGHRFTLTGFHLNGMLHRWKILNSHQAIESRLRLAHGVNALPSFCGIPEFLSTVRAVIRVLIHITTALPTLELE